MFHAVRKNLSIQKLYKYSFLWAAENACIPGFFDGMCINILSDVHWQNKFILLYYSHSQGDEPDSKAKPPTGRDIWITLNGSREPHKPPTGRGTPSATAWTLKTAY